MRIFQTIKKKLKTAAGRSFAKNCQVAANQFRFFMFKKFGLFKKYYAFPDYIWDDNALVFGGSEIPPLEFYGKIAVQAHIFYPELAEEIRQNVNCVPCDFDLYVSTDSEEKAQKIRGVFAQGCAAKKIEVAVFENRGRDVLPFLRQLRPVIGGYDLFCHIHSKRTLTINNFHYGESWRKYLYRHLFGSKSNVVRILNFFAQNQKCAMVFPESYPLVEMGVYRPACKFKHLRAALKHYGIKIKKFDMVQDYSPGTMFWARSAAFKDFIQDDWHYAFFKKECGAEDFAFEHSVERVWPFIAKAGGWTFQRTFNNTIAPKALLQKKRLAVFSTDGEGEGGISQSDLDYIAALEKIGCQTICVRRKPGESYFASFKRALADFGFEKIKEYDQAILADNSCFAPIFPLQFLFEQTEGKTDFWGATILPADGDEAERVQQYFMVFEKSVLEDAAFEEFWRGGDLTEKGLAEFFKKKFSCGCRFPELLSSKTFLNGYLDCPIFRPHELLLLGSPLIKKQNALLPKDAEKFRTLIAKISSKEYYAPSAPATANAL